MNIIRLLTETISPMSDIFEVGKTKSLGYLPINFIWKHNYTIPQLINFCEKNNLHYTQIKEEKINKNDRYATSIDSGAFIAWDTEMLSSLLKEHSKVLKQAGVPTKNIPKFIHFITHRIVFQEEFPEAYKAIGIIFGDKRFIN